MERKRGKKKIQNQVGGVSLFIALFASPVPNTAVGAMAI